MSLNFNRLQAGSFSHGRGYEQVREDRTEDGLDRSNGCEQKITMSLAYWSAFTPDSTSVRCSMIREVKKTHETRRVRVRLESLVKHSWQGGKRLSHSWRVADEYDVKRSRWQGACLLLSSRCHFFLFRLEAYHKELNVHVEMFLLTLAIDQDETAEIDREMQLRGDVEHLYVRFHLKTRTLRCRVTTTIPFFARRKQVPQSVWSKKKKRLTCKTEKKVKR